MSSIHIGGLDSYDNDPRPKASLLAPNIEGIIRDAADITRRTNGDVLMLANRILDYCEGREPQAAPGNGEVTASPLVWEIESLLDAAQKANQIAEIHNGLESSRKLRFLAKQIENIAGALKEWPAIVELNRKAGGEVTPKPREWEILNRSNVTHYHAFLDDGPPLDFGERVRVREILNGEAPEPPKGLPHEGAE